MQQKIKDIVEKGQQPYVFELIDGRLLYKGLIMVLVNSPITKALLREYHDSPIGVRSES